MRKRQLLGLVSAMVFNQFAGGQVTTWTNQSGDNLWANPANWNNGVPTAVGEALVPLAGAQIDLGGTGQQVGLLHFSGLNSASLSNGSLTLNELNCVDTSFIGISANLVAAGDNLTIRSGTAYVPHIFGYIDNASSGNTNLRLVSGRISGEVRTTGAVTVSAATTSLQPMARFTAASQLNVFNGGVLLYDSSNTIPDSIPIQLTHGGISAFAGAGDVYERVGPVQIAASAAFTQAPFSLTPRSFTISGQSFSRGDLAVLGINRTTPGTLTVKFDTPITNFGDGTLLTQRAMLPWATINEVGADREFSFATYDSGADPTDPSDDVGLRPLDIALEQRSSVVGATAFDNVRIATNSTLSEPTEIQSLTISNLSSVDQFRRLHSR